MTGSLIRDTYETLLGDVEFDHTLLNRFLEMEQGFISKKPEHIRFFGGTLTGVETVRFTDQEKAKLFDIIHADEVELEELLYNLKDDHHQPVIHQDRKVSSDVFNITCIWMIHRFHNSKKLDENQRNIGKISVCRYLYYKFLTSLLYQYFKYPADPDTARATYANLTNKYVLKQEGNWDATIQYLSANQTVKQENREVIWKHVIEKMDNDDDVGKMLNDLQSRIRDMLKNIYGVFITAHNSGHRISANSSLIESDGEMILKDSTKSPGVYTRYVKSILTDENSFVKEELVKLISDSMPTMAPRLFRQALKWTSVSYQLNDHKQIDEAIDLVMEHAIEYVSSNRKIVAGDLSSMIDGLRGAYMSSRSTEHKLLKARELVEALIKKATNSHNDSGVAAVRTGWMLYVVVRAYSMRYYTSH